MTEQIKVLLVDDDDRNIFALSAYLKAKKIKVETASDGKECLEKLKQLTVDVVLLDMMMPVMDGFETLGILRNDEQLKNNKVIALTALAMKGDMDRCMEAGADDYCTKPVDIDVLVNKINALINK
jgi:two-component system cell cycle response regulator DivK